MLNEYPLPNIFLVEAFNIACHVQNKTNLHKILNKIPHNLYYGRTPNISILKYLGVKFIFLMQMTT